MAKEEIEKNNEKQLRKKQRDMAIFINDGNIGSVPVPRTITMVYIGLHSCDYLSNEEMFSSMDAGRLKFVI